MKGMELIFKIMAAILSVIIVIAIFISKFSEIGFISTMFYVVLSVAVIWGLYYMWDWLFHQAYDEGYNDGMKAAHHK